MQQELSLNTDYWPVSGELLVDEPRPRGAWIIWVMIWVPVLAAAVGFYVAEYQFTAGAVVGLGLLLHTALQPRVAVYALIVGVQVDWLLGFGGGFVSSSKVIGVLALAASLPAISRSMRRYGLDPSMKWILPFAFLPLLLVPASPYPAWALTWVPTLPFIYGISLLLYVHFTDRHGIRMMVMVLLAGALINALFVIKFGASAGILQAAETRVDWGKEVGATGVSDMNELARLISISVLGAIFLFLTVKNKKDILSRMIWVIVGVVLFIGMIFTKARNCYISLPFAMMAAPLLLKGAGLVRRIALVMTIALGAGLVFFVGNEVGMWGPAIQERFQSIFKEGTGAGGRSLYWLGYWKTFLSSGMLGNGFAMTHVTTAYLQVVGRPMAAHNDVINIMGDLGLLGLILFAGMHIHLFRRIRRMKLPWYKAFALSTQIFMLVGGLSQTDFSRRYYGLGIALLIVLIRYDESVRRAEQEQYMALDEAQYLPDQLSPVGQG